jgi:glycosyltransferase involved in cell wall biosynthesis
VPIYNEAGSVDRVQARLKQRDPVCDVVFIVDGSSDDCGARLEALGGNVVRHPMNLGYLDALRTGLEFALLRGYEFVVFFDGDGQHRIEDLNKLVDHHRLHPEDDLLIGSRYLGGQQAASRMRHLVGRVYSLLVRLATGQTIHDVTSGLKLLNRRAMETMHGLVLEDGHAEFLVFMARAGCRVRELSIQVEPRREGSSMYHVPKMVLYTVKTSYLLLLARVTHGPARRWHS